MYVYCVVMLRVLNIMCLQGLARRRGSAPVGLLNRSDDYVAPVALTLRGGGDRFLRRGSVPTDVTRQSRKRSSFSNFFAENWHPERLEFRV